MKSLRALFSRRLPLKFELRSIPDPDRRDALVMEVRNNGSGGEFYAVGAIVGSRNLTYSGVADAPRPRYKIPWMATNTKTTTLQTGEWGHLELARVFRVDGKIGEVDINGLGANGVGNVTRDAWQNGGVGPTPEFDLEIRIYRVGTEKPTVIPLTVRFSAHLLTEGFPRFDTTMDLSTY